MVQLQDITIMPFPRAVFTMWGYHKQPSVTIVLTSYETLRDARIVSSGTNWIKAAWKEEGRMMMAMIPTSAIIYIYVDDQGEERSVEQFKVAAAQGEALEGSKLAQPYVFKD